MAKSPIAKIFMAFALFCGAAVVNVAGAPAYRRDIPRHRGCGTHITAEHRASSERRFQTSRVPPTKEGGSATLDVHFHVIFANQTREGGYVSDEVIQKQIEVLNEDYGNSKTGLSFNLANVTRVQSEDWFLRVGPQSKEEAEMKEVFRNGNGSTLNVWTVGFMEGEGKGLLGYATFPSDYAGAPHMDGVVLLHSSMPDNGVAPYNKGRTLTHEAGHWLGLYHTFEGGCQGSGDSVDDTPPEKEAAYGCPRKRSTCPGGLLDATTNFMNYVDDACMAGFTEGQGTRIRAQIRTFRGVKI